MCIAKPCVTKSCAVVTILPMAEGGAERASFELLEHHSRFYLCPLRYKYSGMFVEAYFAENDDRAADDAVVGEGEAIALRARF